MTRALWLGLSLIAACGSSPGTTDAGEDARFDAGFAGDAAADAAVSPREAGAAVAPEPAAPPMFEPCPPGWRAVPAATPGDPTTCDPYPDGGEPACGPDEMHVPGDAICSPVGSDCPADGWPADLPAADVIFVAPDAAGGGDGSRAAPLPTIAEALSRAGSGTTIALATGSYAEAVVVTTAGVTLRGACASDTIVEGAEATDGIVVEAVEVALRDLTVRSFRRAAGAGEDEGTWAVRVAEGASATLDSLVLAPSEAGLLGLGTVSGRDLRIDDARGYAIAAFGESADVELSRVAVERMVGFQAVGARGGARLAISDCGIRRVMPFDAGFGGGGIGGDQGARVEIRRCAVHDLLSFAILSNTGAQVLVEDTYIARVEPDRLRNNGAGLIGFERAGLVARRTTVEDAYIPMIVQKDSVVLVEDVVFRLGDERASAPGKPVPFDLRMNPGSDVTLSRVAIRDLPGGLSAIGPLTSVHLADVSVARARPDEVGLAGNGLIALRSAIIDGARVSLVRTRNVAAYAHGPGTRIDVADLEVRDTIERGCVATTCAEAGAGIGLGAYAGGHLRAERFLVTGSVFLGVQIALAGEMDLIDGAVTDNPIGANVQSVGFDLDRILDRVDFVDNERDLDADNLPIPEPSVR